MIPDNTSKKAQVYVRKITSRNPSVYKFIKVEDAIRGYGLYCWNWGNDGTKLFREIKSYKEWLRTEI